MECKARFEFATNVKALLRHEQLKIDLFNRHIISNDLSHHDDGELSRRVYDLAIQCATRHSGCSKIKDDYIV